jgi:hypothetical protein
MVAIKSPAISKHHSPETQRVSNPDDSRMGKTSAPHRSGLSADVNLELG